MSTISTSVNKMGSPGCAFCTGGFAHEKLSAGELEEIHEILSSVTLEPPFVSGLKETSAVFCEECHSLLKEAKRLQALLETVTFQLVSLVAKVKVKFDGRSVRVKFEDDDDTRPCGVPSPCGVESPSGGSNSPPKENGEKEEDSEASSAEDKLSIDDDDSSYSNETEEEEEEEERLGSRGKKSTLTGSDGGAKKRQSGDDLTGHYWSCGFCDLKFPTIREKFLHDETVHFEGAAEDVEGATRLYSRICGKSSKTPRDVTAHNESFHSSHQRFLCLSCVPLRRYFSEHLLKAHAVIHSSVGPFSCSLCSPGLLTFDNPCDLDSHLLRVHAHSIKRPRDVQSEKVGEECDNPPIPRNLGGRKVPPCRFCGIRVQKGLFALRLHERKEHAEKFTHLCSHAPCRSTFAEDKEVRTCQETHRESPGIFKCFVCNAKFADGATLREHFEAKHSKGGIKCDECSTREYSAKTLRVHKARDHGKEWPFSCPTCGKGARSQVLLDDHIRSAHKRRDPSSLLSCEECDEKFARRGSLWRHRREKHKGIVGAFTCERCGKVLKSSQSLANHTRSHLGVKTHMCEVCAKSFVHPNALKEHLRSHTGEKPYGCHVCGNRFTRSLSLRSHLEIHKRKGTWKEKPSENSNS